MRLPLCLAALLFASALVGCLEPVGLEGEPLAADASRPRPDAGPPDGGRDAGPSQGDASFAVDAGSCGDPAVVARFAVCRDSQDEASCAQNGGAWTTGPFGEVFCQCRTGQGGCRCTRRDDCLGNCLGPQQTRDCSALSEGACTDVGTVYGCWCFAWDMPSASSPFSMICFD
jgi:hypothetical protein